MSQGFKKYGTTYKIAACAAATEYYLCRVDANGIRIGDTLYRDVSDHLVDETPGQIRICTHLRTSNESFTAQGY